MDAPGEMPPVQGHATFMVTVQFLGPSPDECYTGVELVTMEDWRADHKEDAEERKANGWKRNPQEGEPESHYWIALAEYFLSEAARRHPKGFEGGLEDMAQNAMAFKIVTVDETPIPDEELPGDEWHER